MEKHFIKLQKAICLVILAIPLPDLGWSRVTIQETDTAAKILFDLQMHEFFGTIKFCIVFRRWQVLGIYFSWSVFKEQKYILALTDDNDMSRYSKNNNI